MEATRDTPLLLPHFLYHTDHTVKCEKKLHKDVNAEWRWSLQAKPNAGYHIRFLHQKTFQSSWELKYIYEEKVKAIIEQRICEISQKNRQLSLQKLLIWLKVSLGGTWLSFLIANLGEENYIMCVNT